MALDFNAFQMGQQAVGDPVAEAMQRQQGMLQLQAGGLNNQAAAQQLQMQRIALQRQQTFGQDMQSFLQSPSANGVASLFGKYPEFNKQISDSWNTIDVAQRKSDATTLGSVASLIAKGDYDNAAQIVQTRIDADKAAGRDSSSDEQALSMLKSGDPKQQKAVLGLATIEAAGAVGPEKAGEFLKSLGLSSEPILKGMDQELVTPQGQTLIGGQTKLEHVTDPVTGVSAPFNPYTGRFGSAAVDGGQTTAGGGGQTSGAGGAPPPPAVGGGMQAAITHVFSNEGGYNPKDANGSPTNFGINFKANRAELAQMGITAANFKGMTQEQAAQLYATKYWPKSGAENLPANLQAPYFDAYVRSPALAKSALAQSGGDPQKFVQIASANFQKMASNPNSGTHVYAHAWANRDAKNMAIATGGAPDVAPAASSSAPQTNDPYTFGGAGLNTKEAPQGFAWNATHTGVEPVPGSDTDPNAYSPEMLDDAAKQFIVTGQMPSMGMGGAQMKKAILNRRSEIMQQLGITAEQLPQLQSRYAADKASLTNITQIASGLGASEPALKQYMVQVLQTQKKLVDDDVIGGNKQLNAIRLGTYSSIGSQQTQADIKQYRDAINALQTEYAKFMSSASGMSNTPTTDSARGLATELTDETLPHDAMYGHMQQLAKEAKIKIESVLHQKSSLESQLSSYLQPHSSSAAPSGVAQIDPHAAPAMQLKQYAGLPHGAHYIDPNGVHRTKP